MKYSYNLLKEHIDLNIDEMSELFVTLGHEVEGYEDINNELLVTGKIIEIESHPDATKLNVCKVDIGNEILQIVCGAPNAKKDAYVIVAKVGATLGDIQIAETEIRGVKSQGMLCSLTELGFDSKYFTDEDAAGIYLFANDIELGSDALLQLGFKDKVLDVSLTANRGDCLSYDGMLRDLYAGVSKKYETSYDELKPDFDNHRASNIIDGTYSFCNMELKVDKLIETPIKLKSFLIKHNIKPQNIIVDAANYVMIKSGIPIHTYDSDKLVGDFILRKTTTEEKFIGLDANTYELSEGTLVVCDQEKICSVASVMGSEYTKITEDTTNVTIEIAHFNSTDVRVNGSNFKNKTDALSRGEKGIDKDALTRSYSYFIDILKECGVSFTYSTVNENIAEFIEPKFEKFNIVNTNNVLGIEISEEEADTILTNLHFNKLTTDKLISKLKQNDVFGILEDTDVLYEVPSWRNDIENDNDLIEEVIRVYDLDNIDCYDVVKTFILKDDIIKDKKARVERELEQVILKNNMDQVITYSLISEEEAKMFNKNIDTLVKLLMPQSKQREYYRGSLVPSLIDVHNYNSARKMPNSNIFEISNTYQKNGDVVSEDVLVSGLVSGVKNSFLKTKSIYDFYDLKFIVEEIARYFNVTFEFAKLENEYNELNKYASADIVHDGKVIGFIGQVHPNIIKMDTFVFEINITDLIANINFDLRFESLFTQPNISRDITVDVEKDVLISSVDRIFTDIEYLESYDIIDVYSSEDSNIKAITYSVEFNSHDKKLTSTEIDDSINMIISNIQKEGYEIKK